MFVKIHFHWSNLDDECICTFINVQSNSAILFQEKYTYYLIPPAFS